MIHLYEKHKEDIDPDIAAICFKEIQKHMEDDDDETFLLAGICYENGIGTHADPVKAYALYRRSEESGNFFACSRIAWCMLRGIGTKKDPSAAITYYFDTPNLDLFLDSRTCLAYAECFDKGIGTEKNMGIANTFRIFAEIQS